MTSASGEARKKTVPTKSSAFSLRGIARALIWPARRETPVELSW
jgi:hypothetical protein